MSRFCTPLVAGLVIAVVSLSACSSSGSKSGSSTSPTAGGASVSSKVSGTPVKFVTLSTDVGRQRGADQAAGIKLGIDVVNAAGGVKGRPVEQVACSSDEDVNATTNCLRKALAGGGVLALVGTGAGSGTSFDPLLEAAGVASINNIPLSAADFTCKVCFTSTNGLFNIVAQATSAVTLLKAKRIGVPYSAFPAAAAAVPLVKSFVEPLGGTVVGDVPVSLTAADVTPQAAAEGADKPDSIAPVMSGDSLNKFLQAYRGQGFDTPFYVSGISVDPNQIKMLGSASKNVYITADYNHEAPAYQTFLDLKKKYLPNYPHETEEVLRSYLAVEQFADAANKAAELTPAGVLKVMNSTTDYDADGLIKPAINYTKPQTAAGGKFPRIFKITSYVYKYDNGKFVPLNNDQAINVFTGTTAG